MAFTLNSGTGGVDLASDAVSLVEFQQIKLAIGAATSAAVLAVAGNGVSGTGVLRVTMASDSTGILAGVTTVTTVTTVSTVTSLSQFAGVAISLNTGVRDAGTLRVTIATNDVVPVTDNGGALTVDNGGTFAVQVDGAALTALQLIDNPVLVDDNAFTPATSSVSMAGFLADETAPDAVDEGDGGAARMSVKRIIHANPHADTAAVTSVADTATSTTLLAANVARVGASIQNTSSAVLYVKFGTTATATDFTVRLVQYAYYEVPYGYNGRIDGIWASDPNDGAALVTELT